MVSRALKCFSLLWLLGALSLSASEPSVFISRAEIMLLPTSGPSWNSVLADSTKSVAGLTLSDQNDNRGSFLFAKAMVGVRTNNESMLAEVRAACLNAMETENGGRTLALGRELRAVVIAADLARLSPEENVVFCTWLHGVMREDLSGRTLISTHEQRPNNWGTHAGASRIAADIYLREHGDAAQRNAAIVDLERANMIFKAYCGNRSEYTKFVFGSLSWQSNPNAPVGINPLGALIQGHNVDGVLPDDQRRGGGFTWPPPEENYVREALMGAVDQAEMLLRQGYLAYGYEDAAIYRAVVWLHDEAHTNFDDRGDEATAHIVNFRYSGRDFPVKIPAGYTRSLGYADWTHGPGRPQGVISDPTTPPTEPPTVASLVVSPESLNVTHKEFQTPPPQLVNVTSSKAGEEIPFTVTSTEAWAVPDPSSGTTPQGVTVNFLSNALPVGTHNAMLTLSGPSGAKDVGVSLVVTERDPVPPTEPPTGTPHAIEIRVSANSDDAEERLSGSVSLNDGDTEIVNPLRNKAVGIAFANVGVPVGATVTKASIEFVGNEADSAYCQIEVTAHAVGNAPTFIAAKGNISQRPVVSRSVLWEPDPWEEDGLYLVEGLAEVVDAVVKLPGWSPGNRIVFIFRHKDGTGKRTAENFKRPVNAALLRVTYIK